MLPPRCPRRPKVQIDWDKLGFGLQDVAQVRVCVRACVRACVRVSVWWLLLLMLCARPLGGVQLVQ
jgi:hypothetical protein